MHVAIFGGSFNPPHVGHQLAALYALETSPIDELWFIPCFRHPFDKPLAPFADRLAMCELATAPLGPRVRVSDIERELGGTSRTLNTVKALQAKHPEVRFSLLVGSDLEREIDGWYGVEELRRRVSFLVIGRAGSNTAGALAIPNVSSTEVRDKLRSGQGVEGLVPSRVVDFIRRHQLYEGHPDEH